jgi:hypothetical protein
MERKILKNPFKSGKERKTTSAHALHSRVSGRQLPPHNKGRQAHRARRPPPSFTPVSASASPPNLVAQLAKLHAHKTWIFVAAVRSWALATWARALSLPSHPRPRFGAPARISDEGEGRGAGPEVLRQVEGAAALRIQLRPRHALHGPVRLPPTFGSCLTHTLRVLGGWSGLIRGLNTWVLLTLIPFEIWSLKKFLFVANSVPGGLKIFEISFAWRFDVDPLSFFLFLLFSSTSLWRSGLMEIYIF